MCSESPPPGPATETTVRCFRRLQDEPCTTRRGVWLMTRPSGYRGIFFHGDREEAQGPRYTVEELGQWSQQQGGGFLDVQEISPEAALAELESWPAARAEAIVIFKRHPKDDSEG